VGVVTLVLGAVLSLAGAAALVMAFRHGQAGRRAGTAPVPARGRRARARLAVLPRDGGPQRL